MAAQNGPLFCSVLLDSMKKLASGNHSISYKCIIQSDAYSEMPGWQTLEVSVPQPSSKSLVCYPSFWHGNQMNKVFSHLQKEDDDTILTVCHQDIAMLHRGWDDILVSKIKKRTQIAGVEYSRNSYPRHTNFPCAIMFATPVGIYKKVNPDMSVDTVTNKHGHEELRQVLINDKSESDKYGFPIGSTVIHDAGWNLPHAYREQGYGGFVFHHEEHLFDISGKRNKAPEKLQPPFEVWYYESKPFAIHAAGSSKNYEKRKRLFDHWTQFVTDYIEKA